MSQATELRTERLILRQWRPGDVAKFARMNADPRVMEYFPALPTLAQSEEMAERICLQLAEKGYGLWALEAPGVAEFIGYTGLAIPRFQADFTPCHEIGWRVAFEHWGKGYASEAARHVLRYATASLELSEIVSFTSRGNFRSRRVMERIDMTYDPKDDFEHPSLPIGHPLRSHVLYRFRAESIHTGRET